jgi:oxalate decarboxylase/phosphoglucose isomerase-like protein (cupin superfamily)
MVILVHPLTVVTPREAPEARRLSDLLGVAPGPAVRDEKALRAALIDADPVLYTAQRDAVPARSLPDGLHWRGDLVRYAGGTLADGEPVRSLGHWNPPAQLEVFQVLSGRVLLLMGDDADPATIALAEYGPGDLAVVPRGWFHLTGAPWGPAEVFNIYTDRRHSGGTDVTAKYHTRTPLPYVLAMVGDRAALEPTADAIEPAPEPITERLAPSDVRLPRDLHAFMVEGSEADLEDLRRRMETLLATDWPSAA